MRQSKAIHPWRTQDNNLVEIIQDPAKTIHPWGTQDINLVEIIQDPAQSKHLVEMYKYTKKSIKDPVTAAHMLEI